ncbi:hypothetical protein FB45DRAFT_935399 [Roridomyces roridus]|uniref:Uncharacterized protein n=1 Tax=Roridomyces roridus TaxID=1738132 RepID=A0AAD7BB03_9AGAR|nr:hypothetical protein FB45DRAFT_935399 [Roridomyces roridus]
MNHRSISADRRSLPHHSAHESHTLLFLSATMLSADEFMLQVGNQPYKKRHEFAAKLALEKDPALLTLIQQLLATTPLPSRVPYPSVPDDASSPKSIDLQFPQTTASKSFVQRELGITMAIVLGPPALPVLLDALLHPSNAGKAKIIGACVQYASDEQLLDVYRRCVPAVQSALKESFSKAGRVDLLVSMGVPRRPAHVVEPEMVVLERTLSSCAEHLREEAWNKTTLAQNWPHLNLRSSQYVAPDSQLNLVEKLFELLETYPPTRPGFKSTYKLPNVLNGRLLSFLKTDLPRSLALVNKLCRWVGNGKLQISLPARFAKGRYYADFWHRLDLDTQRAHVEPFLISLVQSDLLKSGQLAKFALLEQSRWQVVHSVAMSAIALLGKCKPEKERPNVISFVLEAIQILQGRIATTAAIEAKQRSQAAFEEGAADLIAHAIKQFLASLTASEKSDEEIVAKLRTTFLTSVLRTLDHHHTLVKVPFESARGVFSMQHVSAGLLQGIALEFMDALKPKTRNVFTIPGHGVTQPYSNLPSGDNDAMFQIVTSLWPPRDHLHFYTHSISQHLSQSQKEHIWTQLDDPAYLIGSLTSSTSSVRSTALAALNVFPPSPSARHAIVQQALAADGTDAIILQLYALCDITDPTARAALQKMTYTRLFDERLEVYRTMIQATDAADSVSAFIDTIKFFVPRIKNEIPPDAEQLPYLFDVTKIIGLFRRATEEEAREIAAVYVAWEAQVNEAVSSLYSISSHIMSIVNYCLSIFVSEPSGVFFQMALQILWARCLQEHGLSKAKAQFVTLSAYRQTDLRTAADELAFRTFVSSLENDNVDYGFYRIQDEVAYVEFMYEYNQKVFEPQVFDEENAAYPAFVRAMLGCLGTRWERVPRIRAWVERQMGVLRAAKGTGDVPADWSKSPLLEAVQFVRSLGALYKSTLEETPPAWWTEFRDLRLLSTATSEEWTQRWGECSEEEGNKRAALLDSLVQLLLRIDDTAVYLHFVAEHIINHRQDLLLDRFITTGKYGVFNRPPADYTEGDKIPPATWNFRSASRFTPHQCEVFGDLLLEIIRSNEYPLHERVQATERFTKLPTTTIHELAALLVDEELNPRIAEAILMFLPSLDEPAAGIELLLAPAILSGELARTAVYSVKRSLEHVPLKSVSTFLEPPTAKPLRIGVFKELVRIISTYLELPEMQDLVKRLWDRPLHQDVRIALLQSILPALDSPYQELAWLIIDKAVAAMSTLQADDTLFVLLAVQPKVRRYITDDVMRNNVLRSPVLSDMATVIIPAAHCDRYVETVIWPLTKIRLNVELAESIKADKKKSAELAERIPFIRSASYLTLFDSFLKSENALSFAERAFEDSRAFVDVGAESYRMGDHFGYRAEEGLYLYLIECIGHCVAHNSDCWRFLVETVDFLAQQVASFQQNPTTQGHRSITQLLALRLGDNFLFHGSESLWTSVPHDRMELIKPLVDHGVQDFFATVLYQRRFVLYRNHVARVLRNTTDEDVLPEARALLAENIRLSHSCHHSFEAVIANLVALLGVIPLQCHSVFRAEILAGEHGIAEAPWVNSIQLTTLERAYSRTAVYANELRTFHGHIVTQQPTFYQQRYTTLESLIRKLIDHSGKDSDLTVRDAFELVVVPVIERQRNNEEEREMVVRLFKDHSYQFFTLAPECAQGIIHDALVGARLGKADSLAKAREMVALLVKHVTLGSGKDAASFAAAFFLEMIYSGKFSSTALNQSSHSDDVALTFPYFFGRDDVSGGDIEDRRTKSTLAAVQGLYDSWKTRHAASFTTQKMGETSKYSSSTALLVILDTYQTSPKLILANPSVFLSCLCLALSDADLHSYAPKLFSSLRDVLAPVEMHKKRSTWVPPAELTLSFVRKLLVELPEEVLDAVVGTFNVGVTESKYEGVNLLSWWADTFFSDNAAYKELVDAEGRERLLGVYGELRAMAVGDEDAIVRVTALQKLRKAKDLVVTEVKA